MAGICTIDHQSLTRMKLFATHKNANTASAQKNSSRQPVSRVVRAAVLDFALQFQESDLGSKPGHGLDVNLQKPIRITVKDVALTILQTEVVHESIEPFTVCWESLKHVFSKLAASIWWKVDPACCSAVSARKSVEGHASEFGKVEVLSLDAIFE